MKRVLSVLVLLGVLFLLIPSLTAESPLTSNAISSERSSRALTPRLNSITPDIVLNLRPARLLLTGSDFTSSFTISLNGNPLPPTIPQRYIDARHLEVILPTGYPSNLYVVTITNQDGQRSNGLPILIPVLTFDDLSSITSQGRGDSGPQPNPILTNIRPSLITNNVANNVHFIGSNFGTLNGPLIPGIFIDTTLVAPGTFGMTHVSDTELILHLPANIPPDIYSLRVGVMDTSSSQLQFSETKTLEVQASLPAPEIVQVTPIGMKIPITQTTDVLVTIWGDHFEATGTRVKIDNTFYTGQLIVQNNKKILFTLPPGQARAINEIVVVNSRGQESPPFPVQETTFRAPDFIDIDQPVITSSTSTLTIKGHNFFPTTSRLYVDNTLIPSTQYTLSRNSDNSFTLTLQLQGSLLTQGTHTLRFDNPPRYPGRTYNRFASNKLFYAVVPLVFSDFICNARKLLTSVSR